MNTPSGTECACPLCGSTTLGSELEDHLEAHSKQDLIQLLLQRQPFTESSQSRKYPCFEFNSTSSCSRRSADGRARETPNYIIPHHSRSIPSLQPLPFTSTRVDDEDESSGSRGDYVANQNDESCSMIYGLGAPTDTTISLPVRNVKLESGTCPSTSTMSPICDIKLTGSRTHHRVTKSRGINRSSIITEETSCQEITSGHYPDNSPTSTLPSDQDSQFRDVFREESDNATSQTSIIKYIIDQSGKSTRDELPQDPDNWTLADVRTIPVSVYSSFTQGVPRKYVKQTLRVESSKSGDGYMGQIESHLTEKAGASLNLMTDEEIPPRGEISEFEESNTSSLVSEDSKAALSSKKNQKATASSPRKPVNVQKFKPKPRRRGGKVDISATGQFLCYECPVMRSFKSLFELIGHKVKLHPSINITEQIISDDNASSSLPIPLLSDTEATDEIKQVNLNAPEKTQMEFFCVYCHATFDHRMAIAQHMEIDHSDKPPNPNIFECNTCGKIFPARTNLRKHLMVHKERKHVCTTCSKGFTSNFKLLEHARVHTKEYPYKCEVCEKAYRTPSLLNHHAKTVHVPESERPLKPKIELYCGVCHKVLRSKRSYFCHIKSHQASPQKCPYCCETFGRQSVLVRHIRVTHDPQYESSECKECTICQRKLHPNSLIKHMRIHANEKPYSCQVCSKRFRTFANLSSHSWSHTNVDRPFKCRVCPKSYLFKRTLEHHMMVHKRRTLHYVCNECGVRFTNKVNMKRHLDEHYSEKKYKCKTCGKKFQRNYYLLEHERTHSGLKPFLCNICGKASTTKSNHRAHIKIHDARDATSQEG